MSPKSTTKLYSLIFSSLFITACGGSSPSPSPDPIPTPPPTVEEPNLEPTIESAEAITVDEGVEFSLTANATDPDGTLANYDWQQVSGNTAQLTTTNTATLTAQAPAVNTQQNVIFELTVTDNAGATATQQFTVTVQPRQIITNTAKLILDDSELAINPSVIRSTDFDGDGDNDLITIEGPRIKWYENTDNQQLSNSRTIFDTGHSTAIAQDILTEDIDNDGDLDIVAVFDDYWHHIGWINNLGDGQFSGLNPIDGTYGSSQTSTIAYTDVDNDGHKDLLAFYDGQLSYYPFLSGGPDAPKTVIANQAFSDAAIIDFDNDGDMDALSINSPDTDVVLFTNNGNGSFSRTILANFDEGTELATLGHADLDNNGFADIILSSNQANLSVIYNLDKQGTSVETLDLAQFPTNPERFDATDFDGDGDVDIALSFLNTDSSSSDVWLWRNSGQNLVGEFENLTNDYPLLSLHGADLVGDNNKELVLGSQLFHNISMITTDATPQITAITKSADQDGIIKPKYVEVADLDQDGNNDLVIQSTSVPGKLITLNGEGEGQFGQQTVLAYGQMHSGGLAVADFNSDSLKDIVIAPGADLGHALQGWRMFNNLGGNQFGDLISTDGQQEWVRDTLWADIDGDGDNDLVTSANHLAWFENTGNGLFTRHVLLENWGYVFSLALGDMDQDGDVDVVFEVDRASEFRIYWLRNNGPSEWQLAGPVYAATDSSSSELHIADLNNDGSNDLVRVLQQQSSIIMASGNGNFEPPQFLAPELLFRSMEIVDIDHDNDLDIVAISNTQVHIFEQSSQGEMNLNESHDLQHSVTDLTMGDIDSDGDKDLLLTSDLENWVLWIENRWIE